MLTSMKAGTRCEFILKKEFICGVTASENYHFHSIYEVHVPVTGSLHLMVEDRDLRLFPGEVCIIPPNKIHYIFADKTSYRIGFRFTFSDTEKGTNSKLPLFLNAFGNLTDAIVVKNCPVYQKYLKTAANNFAESMPDFMTADLLFLALYETAGAILSQSIPAAGIIMPQGLFAANTTDSSRHCFDLLIYERIESFLNRNYTASVRLEDLAAHLNLSSRQTERVTSRLFGMPFTTLVNKRRLTAAKLLLRATDIPVEQIALNCGFENKNYFYRKFSNAFEQTPGEYRKMHRNT